MVMQYTNLINRKHHYFVHDFVARDEPGSPYPSKSRRLSSKKMSVANTYGVNFTGKNLGSRNPLDPEIAFLKIIRKFDPAPHRKNLSSPHQISKIHKTRFSLSVKIREALVRSKSEVIVDKSTLLRGKSHGCKFYW